MTDELEVRFSRTYKMLYRNYRGEIRSRNIRGSHIVWTTSLYHSAKPAAYLRAFDIEKEDIRDFNVPDILKLTEVTSRWRDFWNKVGE